MSVNGVFVNLISGVLLSLVVMICMVFVIVVLFRFVGLIVVIWFMLEVVCIGFVNMGLCFGLIFILMLVRCSGIMMLLKNMVVLMLWWCMGCSVIFVVRLGVRYVLSMCVLMWSFWYLGSDFLVWCMNYMGVCVGWLLVRVCRRGVLERVMCLFFYLLFVEWLSVCGVGVLKGGIIDVCCCV